TCGAKSWDRSQRAVVKQRMLPSLAAPLEKAEYQIRHRGGLPYRLEQEAVQKAETCDIPPSRSNGNNLYCLQTAHYSHRDYTQYWPCSKSDSLDLTREPFGLVPQFKLFDERD